MALESIGVPAQPADRLGRLMLFIALFYASDAVAQPGGLINQPLTFYLKEALGWKADEVAAFLSVMILPLVIRPLYGLVSDSLPLFGYKRKSYLVVVNAGVVLGYLALAATGNPSLIFAALLGVALLMAAGSTIAGAIMVEHGKRSGLSGTLINQQWLWFNVAAVFVSAGGGFIAQHGTASVGYRLAAVVAAAGPCLIALSCWSLVSEQRQTSSRPPLRAGLEAIRSAGRSRQLWIVGIFLVLYNFSPGLGTPLYYHMTDKLHFEQHFIGALGSAAAVGAIGGALVFERLQRRLSLRQLLVLSIALAAVGHFAYLLLAGEASAIALSVVNGAIGMIVLVSSLTLAAESCPDGAEGFSYAALTSIATLTFTLSVGIGGLLYERYFGRDIAPLIVASAACTMLALPFVPMLRLDNRKPGELPEEAHS